MVEEEKQQDNEPNSMADIPETVTLEGAVAEESHPELEDWELQVAQAYQSADDAATEGTAASVAGKSVPESELFKLTETNAFLQSELQATKAQLEDITGQYRRLAADFDNFRKRTQKEKEEQDVNIRCATIKELLPVIDNFERARSHIKPQNDGELGIHKSYQSVYKQMVDCLKQLGVSPMRPEGQPFDPTFHEAVMRETTDQYEEGIIIEELVRGYSLGERILRHALVKVAAAPEPVVPSEESNPENSDS